jgi:DNA-binding NarL/FixJ family response regulator
LEKIRVMIQEDNVAVHNRLLSILDQSEDFAHVTKLGATNNGENPHILLLSISPDNTKIFEIVVSVQDEVPSVKIIGIAYSSAHPEIVNMIVAGVDGFIMSSATNEVISSTVRKVARGEKVLPKEMVGPLFCNIKDQDILSREAKNAAYERLSLREKDIVAFIENGLSNKEIAERLNVSTSTVKNHVHSMLKKLDIHSRLRLANIMRIHKS